MRRGRHLIKFGLGAVVALHMSAPAQASFHFWEFKELFSNADGTVQFIELFTVFDLQELAFGETFRATQGANTHDFVFPSDTPAPTGNHHLLLATAAFASLPGAVAPDFIIPDGFLFTPNGMVENLVILGDTLTYAVLPTDGILSLNADLTTGPNSPTNYAGQTGSIDVGPPEPVPATSAWGLLATMVGLVIAAWVFFMRTNRPARRA